MSKKETMKFLKGSAKGPGHTCQMYKIWIKEDWYLHYIQIGGLLILERVDEDRDVIRRGSFVLGVVIRRYI